MSGNIKITKNRRDLLSYDPSDWGYKPSQDFRITMRVIPLLLILFLGFSVGYTFVYGEGGTVSRVMNDYAREHKADLEHAYQLYLEGDYTGAVRIASDIAAQDPENSLAHHILGLSHAKRGFTEEAAASFNRAVALDGSFVLAWFNLGIVEESRGEYSRALEAYSKAAEFDPANSRYVDAVARMEKVVMGDFGWDLSDAEDEKLFMDGIAAVNSTDPEDYIYAENIFRTLLLDRPYDVATRNMLGFALARQGRLDEAERIFIQVIEIEPGFSEAWYNLGIVHKSQDRLEEALQDFETALSSSSVESFRNAVQREINTLTRQIETE